MILSDQSTDAEFREHARQCANDEACNEMLSTSGLTPGELALRVQCVHQVRSARLAALEAT